MSAVMERYRRLQCSSTILVYEGQDLAVDVAVQTRDLIILEVQSS